MNASLIENCYRSNSRVTKHADRRQGVSFNCGPLCPQALQPAQGNVLLTPL